MSFSRLTIPLIADNVSFQNIFDSVPIIAGKIKLKNCRLLLEINTSVWSFLRTIWLPPKNVNQQQKYTATDD